MQLCYLSRNIGTHRSYINMMDREPCCIQIDAVYEPHYQHFGDKFGSVIAGFFSDEPELGNNSMYKMYNLLGTEQDLPWSQELAAALEERLGKGYAALLPLLWSNDCSRSLGGWYSLSNQCLLSWIESTRERLMVTGLPRKAVCSRNLSSLEEYSSR